MDTETSAGRLPGLGHAGILLIDRANGHTEYFEYGRYDSAHLGFVRQVHVPNVQIGTDPISGERHATETSLHRVLDAIDRNSGQSGPLAGAYVHGVNGEAILGWAHGGGRTGAQGTAIGGARWEGFGHPTGEHYSILLNNCMSFVQGALQAGGVDLPWMVDPRPTSYIDELRDSFDDIDLTPRPGGGTELSIKPESASWFDFLDGMTSQLEEADSPEDLAGRLGNVQFPQAFDLSGEGSHDQFDELAHQFEGSSPDANPEHSESQFADLAQTYDGNREDDFGDLARALPVDLTELEQQDAPSSHGQALEHDDDPFA